MSFILGLIFSLFQTLSGIYFFLLFSGRITPKFKFSEQEVQFNNIKTKYGKLLSYGGILISIIGAVNFFM